VNHFWQNVAIGAIPVLLMAMIAAVWRGLIALHDNTTAIKNLREQLSAWQTTSEKNDGQIMHRLDVIEQWRTQVEGAMFQKILEK
jgi:hypothetical protein